MTDPDGTWDPPQDTDGPDAVESDAAALTSAEDLDEDSLHTDPLDAGMDPPERWSGATEYGTTPWEQAHPRDLGDRLDEEEPDIGAPSPAEQAEEDIAEEGLPVTETDLPGDYERTLGISADIAGGSVTESIRDPEEPE
ncbi:hypothetical protein BJY24_004294 [Nocardia transvalensis]|uniref:DUF5709 domain-containing protein n=1 Tax=Nocardia transvalensis TaxID=37333 RepID=A0A7W9PFV8_9NOCA|nr:hypothetical protein [Nocardia transvalensis]MBB5915382.1 hypothetical protein [Nocardia transvalensis]